MFVMVLLASIGIAGCGGSSGPRPASESLGDASHADASDALLDVSHADATPTVADAAHCPAATSSALGPFPVTFRVRNAGATPVFFRNGCLLEFQIASCAAGYADSLQNRIVCPVRPCSMPMASIPTCGGCALDHGDLFAPGATRDLSWDGVDHAFDRSKNCVTDRVLPSGRYRIRVPVYASPEAALARQNPRTIEVDFSTPVAGGVVEVTIPATSTADDAGAPDALADAADANPADVGDGN
jgi:hypothetical protein